jgi:membrane protein implicated in regulation of membrane protease activity
MRSFLRLNSLSLFFGLILLLALVGQALTGQADYNAQQVSNGLATISLGRYVTSSAFGVDVAENWQSEFLQFLLYIVATVWLVQRGSPESKTPGDAGTESDEEQKVGRFSTDASPPPARRGGWVTAVYSNSLGAFMGLIFLACWAVQSLAGRTAYSEEQLAQLQAPVSWLQYVGRPDFWNRTLQNWQSEFLAVGSMAVFSIYLRQRGSPESKPVGAAHSSTGTEG